ncbi:MAG: histidine--tRNA ligase [Deltaproteobacteria bacterium]|nr:histidine--tRNA ligase [Deltaproteobacteria bacterium]
MITAVRGFKDILPPETDKWRHIEATAHQVFRAFGYREIRIPLVEKTELFSRGIGESTDIVEKEMYTFVDRGDESLTLRPEATASVIRAYLEHALHASETVTKLYTMGPMFRRERPQKGRYRQFHQIDAEILGPDDPRTDAELILMLVHFLNKLGLTNLNLEINSLGCAECRPAFRKEILSFLKGREEGLCGDCRRRLGTNPLRVFDCKVETCAAIISEAPLLPDFLCSECRDHFDKVQASLRLFDLPFHLTPKMVRGLDYYTRTTFEVTTEFLGAQNAVVGGGRYDHLVRDLGGPDISGIGFAIGFERLAAMIPEGIEGSSPAPLLFVAALGEPALEKAFQLCNRLRMRGVHVEMDHAGRSLKSQMKRADKVKSTYALILGDREIQENKALLRNMRSSTQEEIRLDDMEETILKIER